ncbi:MAG: hypothetical protein HOP19_24285 [Acidobacteria bacterium]|nr:hypothetical protein [Acidobacteriota bacterium]
MTEMNLTRRRLLMGLGSGLAASTLAPSSLFASTRQANAPILMGAGNHKYEWVRGWGKLPEGMKYGSTHGGIQVDSKNNVYLNTDTDNAIMVFNESGKYLRSFGKEWNASADGTGTHGMQLRKEGGQEFIYLTNLARKEFAKITLTGEIIWRQGLPEKSGVYQSKDQFKPTGIAVAPDGSFYVTDGYGQNFIHRFNAKGEYQNSWGGKVAQGERPDGKFNTPHAVIVDTRGAQPLVLATDRALSRLQWFTLEGKHVKTLDGKDSGLLRLPAALHIRGTDLVIGDLSGRVTILDKDNNLVAQLGDQMDTKMRASNKFTPDQWSEGKFASPHGITWDNKGNLYIEEWMLQGRIVKLKRVK